MDWFSATLKRGESCEWVAKNPELSLGILSYAIVSKTHHSPEEIKTSTCHIFSHVFNYMYKYAPYIEDGKNTKNIKGNIIALNNLFMLIDQIKNEGAYIYYAPVICEFITSSFAQEREKSLLKKRLLPMLFSEIPEQVCLGIFKTFALLESRSELVPDALSDTYQKTKKESLQRIVRFQNAHPVQLRFLSKIGIHKTLFPRSLSARLEPISSGISQVKDEDLNRPAISEPSIHMKLKDSQHVKIFADSLDELLNKKLLNRLEHEKDVDIRKILQYYERLSISSYKVASGIPIKILQHSLVWNTNKNDLKKAAYPYIKRKAPDMPNFVPILVAWCTIHENDSLSSDFAWFDKDVAEIFLDSSCFFMSIYAERDKETKWKEIGGYFRIFIRPSTFPGLSRIHAKHPWTLAAPDIVHAYTGSREDRGHEVTQFYASKLIEYKCISTIIECNLEYEAYCELKQHTGKDSQTYVESLRRYITDSAKSKNIKLEKNSKQKPIVLQIEDILEHAQYIIKKYSEENIHLKEIVRILLMDEFKGFLPLMLKDILDKTTDAQRTPIFLKIVYIFTVLETDLHSLANITQTLNPITDEYT